MALKLSKKSNKVQKVVKTQRKIVKPQRAVGATAVSTVTAPTGKYVEAVGRRKVATARVRLYEDGGEFVVNDKIAGQYFGTVANSSAVFNKAFEVTGTKGKFGVNVHVTGSGVASQLGAVVHGIARALVAFNPEFKALLKPSDLLTRDDRMKETRKIGSGGKARRKRQSPKR